ncbi:E3 ubiquitin-protein ligase synoviolin [Chytridiales sp. JEL 0842]|nr:E3 ubiquitin-protein ligase synoviolin [Chytridiales sp. JEL 0842]
MLGRAMQSVFFGQLRAIEVEHLYDRSWFAVTETCMAMTIFRDDFDIRFIVLFAMLVFIKIFHWITHDRVDFMEQAMNLRAAFHIRMISIMSILILLDVSMLAYAVQYTLRRGPSMMIIFGFEYTILVTSVLSTLMKYILHTIDLRRENPWEEKTMYLFYVDLVVDFFKLLTYFAFFAVVVHYYGLPLHIIRDLYTTLRSFVQRCRDLIQYRRATVGMQERYPEPTVEELNATDRVCIICREEMELANGGLGAAVANNNDGAAAVPGANAAANAAAPNAADAPLAVPAVPNPALAPAPPAAAAAGNRPNPPAGNVNNNNGRNTTPKKLPCGHIFHFNCLRSWLERQQTCPTCRRSVLQPNTPAAPAAAPGAPAAPAAAAPNGALPPAGPVPVPGGGVPPPPVAAVGGMQGIHQVFAQLNQRLPNLFNNIPGEAGAAPIAGGGGAVAQPQPGVAAPLPPYQQPHQHHQHHPYQQLYQNGYPTVPLQQPLPQAINNNNNNNVYHFTLTPLLPVPPLPQQQTNTIPTRIEKLEDLTEAELLKMEGRSKEACLERLKALQRIQGQLETLTSQMASVVALIPDNVGENVGGEEGRAGSSSSVLAGGSGDEKGKGVAV